MTTSKYDGPISPEILDCISGRDLLIQHLGKWPTFHDFEVLSITFERTIVRGDTHDLRATFFVFDGNRPPDDPERKQGTAEFLFESVDEVRIDGFNHQNPIMGIALSRSHEGRFHVQWGGTCMKHEVSFQCERISVLRVMDLNPFRKAFPTF